LVKKENLDGWGGGQVVWEERIITFPILLKKHKIPARLARVIKKAMHVVETAIYITKMLFHRPVY
jgi:branched-subunit amino acid transport protein